MRMRRKKNLEARLQECESYLLDCDTADLNFENEEGNKCLYSIEDIFSNENPLDVYKRQLLFWCTALRALCS